MFPRSIPPIVATWLLASPLAFPADNPPPPPHQEVSNPPAAPADASPKVDRTQFLAIVFQKLVADISRLAKAGDADLAKLLEAHHLNGDIDWKARAEKPQEMERQIQELAVDLLVLREHNENARALVEKFQIKQAPAP